MKIKYISFLVILCLFRCTHPGETGVPEVEPGLLWKFETGGPVRSTPKISDQSIIVGSDDGCLFAVEISTGEEQWRFLADAAISSDPCLDGDSIFVSTKMGTLFSVRKKTGALNWSFNSDAESLYEGGWDYFVSSPVVVGEKVIYGSGDCHIRALSKESGDEIWAFDAGAMIRSTPAVYLDYVVCGTMNGELYALSLQSGEEIWKFKTEGNQNFPKGEILFQPLIHNKTVYFGSRDATFYALSIKSGELLWKVQESGPWYTKAAAVSDLVFAASSDGRFVQALEASSGEEKWKFLAGDLIFSQPVIYDGILYFGSHDTYVYALNLENGRLVKTFKTGDAVLSSPAISGGVLYVGSDDGSLYAFHNDSAGLQKRMIAHRAVYWDPNMDAKADRYLSFEEQKVLLYLKDMAYEILDASDLENFMEEVIRDKTCGTIVLLSVNLPYVVFESTEDQPALFKRYLGAHNSFVSIQSAAYMVTSRSDEDEIFVPRDLPQILGFSVDDFRHAFFFYDSYISHPTEEGKRLGLPSWWSSGFGIQPDAVDTILGRDEHGRATAWVKSFGGPELSGFIRIWGGRNIPDDLSFITNIVESIIREFCPDS